MRASRLRELANMSHLSLVAALLSVATPHGRSAAVHTMEKGISLMSRDAMITAILVAEGLSRT